MSAPCQSLKRFLGPLTTERCSLKIRLSARRRSSDGPSSCGSGSRVYKVFVCYPGESVARVMLSANSDQKVEALIIGLLAGHRECDRIEVWSLGERQFSVDRFGVKRS